MGLIPDEFTLTYFLYHIKKFIVSNALAPRPTALLLDVAYGRGEYCIWLSIRGAEVFGVEIDLENLRVAAKRLKLHAISRTHLIRASGARLPFIDALSDGAICTDVLHIPRNYEDVVKQISRCLKPEGTFVATFINEKFPPRYTADKWIKKRLGGQVQTIPQTSSQQLQSRIVPQERL